MNKFINEKPNNNNRIESKTSDIQGTGLMCTYILCPIIEKGDLLLKAPLQMYNSNKSTYKQVNMSLFKIVLVLSLMHVFQCTDSVLFSLNYNHTSVQNLPQSTTKYQIDMTVGQNPECRFLYGRIKFLSIFSGIIKSCKWNQIIKIVDKMMVDLFTYKL